MKVSIILPSYNRYPLNLYTLYALEKQSFNLSEMEVILIDDASTDQTPLLKDYKAPFPYKYVRNKANQSLAATRNRGSKMAQGEVLIFLDAEMLVDPDFVKYHYQNHVKKDNIVVVGGTERGKIFSHLFPEYDRKQMKRITSLLKNSSIVRDRFSKSIGKAVSAANVANLIKGLKKPVPVLFKEDILDYSTLKPFISKTKNINNLLTYLSDDFENSPIAWMTTAGNLSLKKSLFEAVGGYEEKFKGWGPEDSEFAYRLKKYGAHFVVDHRLKRVHQEHPKQTNKVIDDKRNWVIFLEKHPDLDIGIRAISRLQKKDYKFFDQIIREKVALNQEFPGKYKAFEESLVTMLKQIFILEFEGKPIKHLIESSGISGDGKRKKIIFDERNKIDSDGKYNNLIKLFDLLTKT